MLGDLRPDDPPAAAGRRLLGVAPDLLGAPSGAGAVPQRLLSAWGADADPALLDAVRVALVVLADHGLATSTLAVRVAASVRTTAAGALAAGLATVAVALHGSAAASAHDLLAACARDGASRTVAALRRRGDHLPGFGHKIYRRSDPRFAILAGRVRAVATADQAAVIDELLAAAGRAITAQPNVDLALGALSWAAGLDRDLPLFAVARIAGWAAHCAEELEAPPVRYRGLARPV